MVKYAKAFLLQSTILLFIAVFCITTKAETLFEGYAKVISDGSHVGFFISKYEVDNKKKQWIAKTYLKTNAQAGNINERLTAVASDDMTPISYVYTSMTGEVDKKNAVTKTIDAQFKKGKMTATITETGKPVQKISKDIPKGVFLSSFLVYVMGKSPKGLVVDTKYDYQAIAEEDASIEKGMAFIKNQEDFLGQKVFRILNDFKKNQFISYVNEKGEILSTRSPAIGISTELVAQPSIALGNLSMSAVIVKSIFGEIPLGINNEVARLFQEQKKPKDTAAAPANPSVGQGKQEGVPPKKGLILKTQSQPTKPETEGKTDANGPAEKKE